MLGLVVYRGGELPKLPDDARVCAVTVPPGTSPLAALAAHMAADALRRAPARVAVFPPDYAYRAAFARRGVAPAPLTPLYRATAVTLTRAYMAQRGVAPERATVAFAAREASPQLRALIGALAGEVRYMALCVPRGGEALARELRRSLGVAPRLFRPGEPSGAALTVCFDDGLAAAGETLPLYAPALEASYAGSLPASLLAGLFAVGALDAAALEATTVTVRAPEDADGSES
ncbi:MAG: hypothetical protein E7474_11090 [Ruminococcaceae bacterium]|nr:hypothetical protein [Oscillospiraceae bacterium]